MSTKRHRGSHADGAPPQSCPPGLGGAPRGHTQPRGPPERSSPACFGGQISESPRPGTGKQAPTLGCGVQCGESRTTIPSSGRVDDSTAASARAAARPNGPALPQAGANSTCRDSRLRNPARLAENSGHCIGPVSSAMPPCPAPPVPAPRPRRMLTTWLTRQGTTRSPSNRGGGGVRFHPQVFATFPHPV
jgi:hypothetical protein